MARSTFQRNKRQKELARKQKKEEKKQRKMDKDMHPSEDGHDQLQVGGVEQDLVIDV
ncbi:MAG: hypothetical protein AB1724_17830 [Thermodesulfobacteriota bacterium]